MKECIARKRKTLSSSLDSGLFCSVCGREILAKEKYWKKGREWKYRSYRSKKSHTKISTIKIYCDGHFDSKGIWVKGCIETIYVDADD
jgi:hypothetical protein